MRKRGAEKGARRLVWGGYSAWYSPEEQRSMLSLPAGAEGARAAALIHEAMVFADATVRDPEPRP